MKLKKVRRCDVCFKKVKDCKCGLKEFTTYTECRVCGSVCDEYDNFCSQCGEEIN